MEYKIWLKRTYLRNRNREKRRGGTDRESGISKCKLFHVGWINNKVLLQSTGNYIQYPVINHDGKEYEKERIYVF